MTPGCTAVSKMGSYERLVDCDIIFGTTALLYLDPIGVLRLAKQLLLLRHKLKSSAYFDSLGGCLEGQLGSCKFDLARSAERSPVKTRNSAGLSMDP